MRHLLALGDDLHSFWLARRADGDHLIMEAGEVPIAMTAMGGGRVRLSVADETVEAVVAVDGDDVFVHVDGAAYHGRLVDPIAHYRKREDALAQDGALAPMPGTVVLVAVRAGQRVAKGDLMLVMESMKLETAIKAWRDGVVASVAVEAGRGVERGALLIALEPQAEA